MERLHSMPAPLERLRELLEPYAPDEGLSRELDLDADLGLESHTRVELFEELSRLVPSEKALEALFRARTVGDLQDVLSGVIPPERKRIKKRISELDPPRSISHLFFTAWVFTVLFTCFFLTWIVNLCIPNEKMRRRTTKLGSRIMCFLSGVPIKRKISPDLPAQGIFVSNHTSYIDVPIIYSTLPSNFCFVAKIELSRAPLVGFFFRRLGTQFIERFDAREARAGLLRMEEVLKRGDSLFFFPEGTFQGDPGVLPFRSGAFLLAERFKLPVIPVSLAGTREVFRDGRGWVRRVPVTITVHNPLPAPERHTLRERKTLLRKIIAEAVQEPVLD